MNFVSFGSVDDRVHSSATGQIVVYLATVMAIMAVPVIVISSIHAIVGRIRTYECAFEGIFAVSAVCALLLMQKGSHPHPVSDYGFKTDGIVTLTAIGAGIGLAIMSALMNLMRVFGIYHVFGVNLHFSVWQPALLFFFVAVAEETVFRGFIFNTLEKNNGTLVALTSTSIAFGMAHMLDPLPGISVSEHLKAALFVALEAGVLFNAAFLVTRTLWLNIGIHWAWNFFQGPFYGAPVSGSLEPTSFYLAHFSGSSLATGGLFGPEASVYCLIIATTAGMLMVFTAVRRGQWRPNPQFEQRRNNRLKSELL